MTTGLFKIPKLLLVLVLGIALLALACAGDKEEAAAPAPAPAAAPTAVAAPAPAPAPAVTAVARTQATTQEVKVLDPRTDEPNSTFIENVTKFHNLKLPLWDKASYGGVRTYSLVQDPPRWINPFKSISFGRANVTGQFFIMDVGTCSLLGRTDYSRCHGVQNNNYQGTLVPAMVDKWTQPDPLTTTLTLQEGILWPAIAPLNRLNREVTAEDVKWYFETQKAEGIFKDTFELVDSIEVVDRLTVKLNFSSPEADFLRMLASGGFGIVSKECYDVGNDCLDVTMISPGAFIMDQETYVPRQKLEFHKNEEFYLKGLPYLDTLNYISIRDPAAVKAAFKTGKTDFTSTYSPSERDLLIDQVPDAFVVASICACGSGHFGFQIDKKPFDDVRVRRALSMAIDRPAVWAAASEGYNALGMPMGWDMLGLELPINLETAGPYYQYDLDEAKRLLAEAGYADGFKLPVWTRWITRFGTGEVLAVIERSYAKINVELVTNAIDPAGGNQLREQKDWEGFLHDVRYVSATDMNSYFLQTYSKSPQNRWRVNDPAIDALYFKARAEFDPIKRQDILWQYQDRVFDQIYGIHVTSPLAFHHLRGYLMNTTSHLYSYIHFSLMDWVGWIDPDRQAELLK